MQVRVRVSGLASLEFEAAPFVSFFPTRLGSHFGDNTIYHEVHTVEGKLQSLKPYLSVTTSSEL